MQAPTVDELLKNPTVMAALEKAWNDSLPDDPQRRHEEGGWIYLNLADGQIFVSRSAAGGAASLVVSDPPLVADSIVVATFHTHPNPISEGWNPGPSAGDTKSAHLFGVPCLIRAEDGFHTTGPNKRRGGAKGNAGFPA